MHYVVISHFDSILEVTLGFKSHVSNQNHLGIKYIVLLSIMSHEGSFQHLFFFHFTKQVFFRNELIVYLKISDCSLLSVNITLVPII